MIDPGRYTLSNGRTVYYDDQTPRQIALLVNQKGVEYGRCFDIAGRAELFGATHTDYQDGDVIWLDAPIITPCKSGPYVIVSQDAPFTVFVARLMPRWKVPTTTTSLMFEIRWHVAMGQRPYIPYPHVPICPDCRNKGLGVDVAHLYLKRSPDGRPIYICEHCQFGQIVELD